MSVKRKTACLVFATLKLFMSRNLFHSYSSPDSETLKFITPCMESTLLKTLSSIELWKLYQNAPARSTAQGIAIDAEPEQNSNHPKLLLVHSNHPKLLLVHSLHSVACMLPVNTLPCSGKSKRNVVYRKFPVLQYPPPPHSHKIFMGYRET